jgi:hypothetical protein
MSQESKKQTAVEWFNDEILIHLNFDQRLYLKDIFEQAKEMEKEQKEFCWDIAYLSGGFVGKGLPPQEFPTFEQYYAEVYGKE